MSMAYESVVEQPAGQTWWCHQSRDVRSRIPYHGRAGYASSVRGLCWFADGLIAPVDGVASTIGDMRYAAEASRITPLWGMRFNSHQLMVQPAGDRRIAADPDPHQYLAVSDRP